MQITSRPVFLSMKLRSDGDNKNRGRIKHNLWMLFSQSVEVINIHTLRDSLAPQKKPQLSRRWISGSYVEISNLCKSFIQSILHQDDRKLRKITTVAAVRSSEAQGVVQYMQVWIGNTSGKIDVELSTTSKVISNVFSQFHSIRGEGFLFDSYVSICLLLHHDFSNSTK